jgi:hypothetical protein
LGRIRACSAVTYRKFLFVYCIELLTKNLNRRNFYRQDAKSAKKIKKIQDFKKLFGSTFLRRSWCPWRLGGDIGFMSGS